MHLELFLILFIFILIIKPALGQENMKSEPSVQVHLTDMEQTAIASNRFALDMYRELAGNDENLFFSPWSLNVALAMTYEGARGKTADEMRSVLHFYGDESARRQSFFCARPANQ